MFQVNIPVPCYGIYVWYIYKIITEIFLVHNIFQYRKKQDQLEDQVDNSAFKTCPFWDGELTYVFTPNSKVVVVKWPPTTVGDEKVMAAESPGHEWLVGFFPKQIWKKKVVTAWITSEP